MEFRISDTFTDSLTRLTGDEQKAVKMAAFDLQMNPAHPSLQFHKLEKAKDPRFWSVRVNADMRLIIHRSETSLLLCYVDHHEQAYHWAGRRKLETHPKTGAAQLVEIRETVVEIQVPRYVDAPAAPVAKSALFAGIPDDELLGYGVPQEWLSDVRAATEDSLLVLADHLPSEAAEALLELATGAQTKPQPVATANPFEHPDALRRFRMMKNVEELTRALDYPWEKWTVFLHPAQRQLVERDYAGPARVSGSAGTGKTIVALHRAAFLVRSHPDARVLLTTFSDTLSNALATKLRRLIGNAPRLGERIEVHSMNAIGARLYELNVGRFRTADRDAIKGILAEAAGKVAGQKFSTHFLMTEWEQVVDAWQVETWAAYRDVLRLGRKTRLSEHQRKALWSIFAETRLRLRERGLITTSEMFSRVAEKLRAQKTAPFDYVVVDEAQDISVAQMRFLAALGAKTRNRLFLAGDLGQRIFQQPFSWKALGVDVRGRSFTLRINYRTSHQIRMQADRLLAPEVSDVDGNAEQRKGTISLFNGPQPTILVLDSVKAETAAVAKWLTERISAGGRPHELGVFVRSAAELERAQGAVKAAGLPFKVLDEHVDTPSGHVLIGTMHLAKGLEFRSVVVMACDDEVIPSQARIETVADDADLEDVYNTERHLLYVACTRARDHLLVTSAGLASEFLDDLK
jgi:mRNA-degrading endonuclease RelE of RelBE toxin-antitoxin system